MWEGANLYFHSRKSVDNAQNQMSRASTMLFSNMKENNKSINSKWSPVGIRKMWNMGLRGGNDGHVFLDFTGLQSTWSFKLCRYIIDENEKFK